MKKLLKIFSAVAMTAALFSCENGGEQKQKLVPIEIWYSPYTSADAPLPDDWFGYKVIEEKLGIRLKTVPLPAKKDDLDATIMKAARSNSLPDLFMLNRETLVELVKANKVARVDRMFNMMPRRTQMMYTDRIRKNGQFDGLTYGLCQVGSIDRNEGVLIRKDWLDNLGLSVPKTTDDFLNVMRAFTFSDPDKNGKDDTYGFGAFIEINASEDGLGRRFNPFFGAFGVAGTFNASRENIGLNVHKSEYFDALQFISRIVSERVIDPNWVGYKKDDFREAWKNGRFGMMREQNAALALEANYKPFDDKFPDAEWILVNPPVGPEGKSAVGAYTQSYRTFAVSKRTSEIGKLEHLAHLLEWMSTDGYNIITYGQEGVNYRIDENGKVTNQGLPDESKAYTKKEMAPILQLRNLVFYGSDSELEGRYPTWHTKNGKEMSALRLLRDMQSKEWFASVGVPGATPEIRKFYQQGVLDFVTNKRNLTRDNWNAWLSEFDKRGGADWEKAAIEFVEQNNAYVE